MINPILGSNYYLILSAVFMIEWIVPGNCPWRLSRNDSKTWSIFPKLGSLVLDGSVSQRYFSLSWTKSYNLRMWQYNWISWFNESFIGRQIKTSFSFSITETSLLLLLIELVEFLEDLLFCFSGILFSSLFYSRSAFF